MYVDGEALFNQIMEAKELLEEYGIEPTEIRMTPSTKTALVEYVNGMKTMIVQAEDCDTIFGMKIITEI